MTKHRIGLIKPDTVPIHSAPYRAGPKTSKFEKAEIDRMIAENVIDTAQTKWAAPIVVVLKKDETLRFCFDYQNLSALTRRESYPIPRMDECIDSLGIETVFSALNDSRGYWQIVIDDAEKDKATFTSNKDYYCFVRMTFELYKGLAHSSVPWS